MDGYYKINSENITYRIIDNEAVVLNLETGQYYSLNETGTFIWKLLGKGINRDDLINRIAEEFEIDKRSAANDVKPLLKDLLSEKMIRQKKMQEVR